MENALITGIYGQDGAYLARHLILHGYEVYGIGRRTSDDWRLKEMIIDPGEINIIHGDITEPQFMTDVIAKIRPDEIYNLAAQSHVGYSFKNPHLTMAVNYGGLVNIIEAVKQTGIKAKIYQASTSELYGYNCGGSLNEETPFQPRSPYACAKLAAHWAGVNARAEGVFVSNGILFNHESPLRGIDFVTRKITDGIARIKAGHDFVLELGNIDAMRDWGFAGDYVKAMHKILQHKVPDDFVIGSGKAHSVADFMRYALEEADIDVRMEGSGKDEIWYWNDRPIVRINPEFYRPNDVNCLIANPNKAKTVLEWRPETTFKGLVSMMVHSDMKRVEQGEIRDAA